MGRIQRLTYPGALHHVTMRCNNKEFLFDADSMRLFLELLCYCCQKFQVPLYNYCLMTNHVHFLFKVMDDEVLSAFMHRLANLFAREFNATRERKGHLWEGRFRSTIVEEAVSCFLWCMAYIDLNPVRAGMVRSAAEYKWCGHSCLLNEHESLITVHQSYRALAGTIKARRLRYTRLLNAELAREPYSLANALFLGSARFTREMQSRFGLSGTGHRVKYVELGEGIIAVELKHGNHESSQSDQEPADDRPSGFIR